ncbi:MAG: hypothetical protein R3322_20820, partial [Kiloniellales bacterium]|nr:hypothetical protein [Kiloniellales bacterium]
DMSDRLQALARPDAPVAPAFDSSLARADEVKRPGRGEREPPPAPPASPASPAPRPPGGPDPTYPSRNFH